MMKKITFLNLLLCLFLSTSLLAQVTYYVKATGDGTDGLSELTAFTTVNDAVLSASDGDKIIIVGTINQSGQVSIGKSLDFEGLSVCTITATGTSRMYDISTPGKSITFSNITFQNANASVQGAVINLTGDSNVDINNCTFLNNKTTNNGGVVLAGATGILTITNSLFNGNSATRGGAISVTTVGRQLIVAGCTFVNNTVTNDGGAMYLGGNNALSSITNTTIYNNNALNATLNQSKGGGLRIEGTKAFLIQNSLIYGNYVTDGSTNLDSDIGVVANVSLSFNNSIAKKIEPALVSPDDSFSTSIISADLTSSNLAFNVSTGYVEYTLPSTGDDSPIDFGSDGNDAGAWNSGFTLSSLENVFLVNNFKILQDQKSNIILIKNTTNKKVDVEIFNLLGSKLLSIEKIGDEAQFKNTFGRGIFLLVGKTDSSSFSKKFVLHN